MKVRMVMGLRTETDVMAEEEEAEVELEVVVELEAGVVELEGMVELEATVELEAMEELVVDFIWGEVALMSMALATVVKVVPLGLAMMKMPPTAEKAAGPQEEVSFRIAELFPDDFIEVVELA